MANLTSQLAARQLALKMKLEPRLRREMAVVFKTISNDMRALYSTRGAVINASDFQQEIKNILKQHYRRVANAFGKTLRREITKNFNPTEIKQIDDEVDAELIQFIESTTDIRAQQITATTQGDINTAIAVSIAAALVGDAAITTTNNSQIAANAQKEFNLKTRSRPDIISVTETQTAAEGAKFTEASTVAVTAAVLANTTPQELIVKEWVAVLDSRTRIAHVLTDGQRTPINEPFNVGGERMNTPGDTSQGATAGNIINCRCIAAYVIKNVPVVEAVDSRVRPRTGKPNPTLTGVIGV